ncbi:MAG TPA: helix-turn-helix domain-containing protein [Longimicrobiaceae bacterium]|nr:helix-turn-helix domain-containing protein [Longimicrobiaceae bacterium]
MSVRTPRQARSAASLERMLAAAETVLRVRSFEQAALAEIARHAGVTVGAFYARFSSKEALLRHLEERLHAHLDALAAEQAVLVNQAPEEAVPALLRAALGFYREHRGTLRALVLRSWSDAGLRARLDGADRRALGAVAAAVLARREWIAHPDPAAAVSFALVLVGTLLREAVLFRPQWLEGAGWTDERFAGELSRAFLAYLGMEE